MTGRLVGSIGIVAGLTLATNFLGFLREVLLGRYYGATGETDAFFSAFTIVSFSFLIFGASTIQSALMPRYQALREFGQTGEAVGLAKRAGAILLVLLTALMLALYFFARQIAEFALPGFPADRQLLTANIVATLSPLVPLMGLAGLAHAILNSHFRFALPAAAPLVNNISIIAVIVVGARLYGIWALAGGALLGGSLWFFLLAFGSVRIWSAPTAGVAKGEVDAVLRNFWPLIVILFADQVSALAQKALISDASPGVISALHYGAKLSGLPIGVLGMAISTVLFPALIGDLKSRRIIEAREKVTIGIAGTSMLIMPAVVFFTMDGALIVRTAFARGAFDEFAAATTTLAVQWYSLGLLPQAIILFASRLLFAAERVKVAMLISLATSTIHLMLCWLFVWWFGWIGIAVGTTAYAAIHAALLIAYASDVISLDWRQLAFCGVRLAAGGAVVAFFLAIPWPLTGAPLLAFKLSLGTMLYFGALFLMREPTLVSFLHLRA
jgi:putative peptidoglycan lipid II flippase